MRKRDVGYFNTCTFFHFELILARIGFYVEQLGTFPFCEAVDVILYRSYVGYDKKENFCFVIKKTALVKNVPKMF
jgi:hypothetical protein